MIRIAIAVLALVALASNAEARHKATLHPDCNILFPCAAPSASTPDQLRVMRGRYVARQMGFGSAIERPVRKHVAKADWRVQIRQNPAPPPKPRRVETASYGAPSPSVAYSVQQAVSQVVGGRPVGCPHAFCGCGASLEVFGRIIPSLNLAANWLRFPRAAPAPGMVAAKRGHVFVLKEQIRPGVWMAHDSNSGKHLTRLHPRSLAGYTVVNPHGGSV